jgi:hypothetical protein
MFMQDSPIRSERKSLEQLYFYVSDYLDDQKKLSAKSLSHISGCIIASMIDLMILFVFNDYINGRPLVCKIAFLLISIVLFFIIMEMYIFFAMRRKGNKLMDGRAYMERSSILHQVYAFDNIACDGLQICQYYIELLSSLQKNKQNEDAYTDKHQLETLSCLGEFYLYEVVHQLKIMISIYCVIDTNPNLYISLSDTDLIDSYRVNNFIWVSA